MKIEFHKYHGAGNDFIIIDNRENKYNLDNTTIAKMCSRRYGIGADGLMILEKSDDYDFRMKYYNSDGNEGSMCGNGGRCIIAFAMDLGIIKFKSTFIATDGVHHAIINNSNNNEFDISLNMNDVSDISSLNNSYFLNTGSPHHVEFVNNIDSIDVYNKGKEIRYSERYKETNGTNVNFIELNGDYLTIRTYERGVEDETHACGTGATAAAIAFAYKHNITNKEIKLKALGGTLRVEFNNNDSKFDNIVLSGPAKRVFKGHYIL